MILKNAQNLPKDLNDFITVTGFDIKTDVDKITAGKIGQKDGLVIVQARYDKFRVGGDWMRVYRLQVRLLDRFQATIFVSPIGEILKIELFDQLVLMNDALATLGGPQDDRIDPRR